MIYNMLAINPMHIRRSTRELLEHEMNCNKFECLLVTRYGESGFIIKIHAENFETYNRFNQDMPCDLQAAVSLAIDSDCEFLCVADHEIETLKHLPYYKYETRPGKYHDVVEFEDCYCCGKLIGSVEVEDEGVIETIHTEDDVDLSSFFGKR